MKLLQINSVNTGGSTGRTTQELDAYMRKKKHISLIAYSTGDTETLNYQIGNQFEKKIHSLSSRIFGLQGYFSRKGTKELIKYIEKENPDVVRIGNIHSNYINIPMLFKFLGIKDIPTILTLDDCFLYTGKCCHYTVINCLKWQEKCGGCPKLHQDNPSWFFDRTTKVLMDKKKLYSEIPRLGVVVVSNWITNEAKKSILSEAKCFQTIYNWIDLDVFHPVDVSTIKCDNNLNDKFIILGVATKWDYSKGLHDFLELSKNLKQNQIILLVGKMPQNIILPSNIISINETNDVNELVRYYCIADVFLQLSLEESFGKVTAEALSCGTPVIVYNSTANPELVGPDCGYIVSKDNPAELIERIELIEEKGKKYYSEKCRNFSLKNFDMESNIKKYIELFEALIEMSD